MWAVTILPFSHPLLQHTHTHTHCSFLHPFMPLLCYSFNILDVLGSLQALASTGIINQQNNPTGPKFLV